MRHSLIVSSVLLAAASGLSCGDDETARPQAAFFLSLNSTAGSDCSSADTFQLPADGQATATSTTGEGERIADRGATTVTCSVRAAEAPGTYDLDLTVQTQDTEIGYFTVNGVVSETTASDLEVRLQTTGFQLEQESGCTATVDTAIPGAVWLRNIVCSDLHDPRTPGNTCTGRGALIFENCSR